MFLRLKNESWFPFHVIWLSNYLISNNHHWSKSLRITYAMSICRNNSLPIIIYSFIFSVFISLNFIFSPQKQKCDDKNQRRNQKISGKKSSRTKSNIWAKKTIKWKIKSLIELIGMNQEKKSYKSRRSIKLKEHAKWGENEMKLAWHSHIFFFFGCLWT